jgi:hypothetical protein
MPPLRSMEQMLDVIVEPRYDTATIPAAGSLSLTYFQIPIGQGQSVFGAAGVTKSLADTNMDLAGQLPAGYNFRILGFRCQPAFNMVGSVGAAISSGDAGAWSFGGVFQFTIASKPYLRVPLDTIPAGMGPFGVTQSNVAASTSSLTAHGWPALSNAFTIGKKPLDLSQTQNFSVNLSWPIVVPVTTTKPTAAATPGLFVRVYLDGFLYRPIQ